MVPLTSTYILVRPRIFYIGGPFKALWPSNEEKHAMWQEKYHLSVIYNRIKSGAGVLGVV